MACVAGILVVRGSVTVSVSVVGPVRHGCDVVGSLVRSSGHAHSFVVSVAVVISASVVFSGAVVVYCTGGMLSKWTPVSPSAVTGSVSVPVGCRVILVSALC